MNAFSARILIQLYSKEWRARYEKEFMEFLLETPVSLTTVWDVTLSGIRECMTRRLRRRADTFRGVVMARRHSLAQVGGVLLGIVAFSLVAEASPRWTLHRPPEDFRVWSGDSRIRYERGTENVAAAVSAVLPATIASAESTLYKIHSHQPILIYVCATEKNADRLRRSARLDKKGRETEIFISPSIGDPRKNLFGKLIAQWQDLHADGQSSIGGTH